MAAGDAAAAAGLSVVPPTADVRDGYAAINTRGDELAEHITNGGHPWSKISGRPATFPPSAHNHTVSQITDLDVDVDITPNSVVRRGSTGRINVAHPSADSNAATKLYVDEKVVPLQTAINGRALAFEGDGNKVRYTRGPDPTAYAREAGSNRFAAWMDDTLQFGRATSSLRYKDNVTPWQVDADALLSIEPQTFHRRVDDPGVMDFGAIAEHLHDAGLTELVVYDAEGRPDAIHDHRVVWALLGVCRALAARIDDLEGR